MLKGLVDPSVSLSKEQEEHIDKLQGEIDEIWNRRGDYKIDPDAWESMPLFMDRISEEDIEKNDSCRALASIVYDEVPPDEIAENRKSHGDRALRLAVNPMQERRENLARAACHSYTEALQAKGKDTSLSCVIYANRSLAQFIIGNYGHGLEDAQRAIILNPEYHKAYFRGAKCAERIRKYDLALNLLCKGKDVPSINDEAKQEFEELEKVCLAGKEKLAEEATIKRRKNTVKSAKVANMAHAITSLGIKITQKPEVSPQDLGEYGNPQPYIDEDHLLHVPILILYDEYNQTDMLRDVACDASINDLLEELLPVPWDTQHRYSSPSDVLAFYKIDDGIKIPQCYKIDPDWPLLEVFRTSTYMMPLLLPTIHIIHKHSDLLAQLHFSS